MSSSKRLFPVPYSWRKVLAGHVVVFTPDHDTPITLTPEEHRVLSEWNTLTTPNPLSPIIERLCSLKLLENEQEFIKRLHTTKNRNASITRIIVPTLNVPRELEMTLESYYHHAKSHQRRMIFTVIDDARLSSEAEANKEVLKKLKKKSKVQFTYTDRKMRSTYAKKLARHCGVNPSDLTSILLGFPNIRRTYGASRNTALICGAGEMLMTVDTGIYCSPIRLPKKQNGILIRGGGPDVHFWMGDEGPHETADVNFFAEHEKLLGRSSLQAIHNIEQFGELKVEHATPHLLHRLRREDSRVRLSVSGFYGESGSEKPYFYFDPNPNYRIGLLNSAEAYQKHFLSHRVVTGYPDWTLSETGICMAGSLGIDNRDIMPPFFPHFRNEDLLFSRLVQRMHEGSLQGYVPFSVHHPGRARKESLKQAFDATQKWRLNDCLIGIIDRIPPAEASLSVRSRFNLLGTYFQDLGSVSVNDFQGVLHDSLRDRASLHVRRYESHLLDESLPDYYRKDLKDYVNQLQSQLTGSKEMPDDYLEHAPKPSLKTLQKMIGSFGNIVKMWPDLMEAALELKSKGQGPDRPI